MRIARPRRPTVAFKRKRNPPPQATKLLRYSMLAGIVFIVLLGIVFLPRMLVDQTPVATPVTLSLTAPNRLEVASVGSLVSLTKLQANFVRDNATVATLGPPLGGNNTTLSFTDANDDGLLSLGDFFFVSTSSPGCYRLELFQKEPTSKFLVGQKIWGLCSST